MDKLQRAGQDFLLPLIARHRLMGAAGILRALADELDQLGRVEFKGKGYSSRRTYPLGPTC